MIAFIALRYLNLVHYENSESCVNDPMTIWLVREQNRKQRDGNEFGVRAVLEMWAKLIKKFNVIGWWTSLDVAKELKFKLVGSAWSRDFQRQDSKFKALDRMTRRSQRTIRNILWKIEQEEKS